MVCKLCMIIYATSMSMLHGAEGAEDAWTILSEAHQRDDSELMTPTRIRRLVQHLARHGVLPLWDIPPPRNSSISPATPYSLSDILVLVPVRLYLELMLAAVAAVQPALDVSEPERPRAEVVQLHAPSD